MKKNFTLLTIGILAISVTVSLHAQPALDPSFSNDGLVLTKINPTSIDIARTVQIQPNGKILVGGNSFNSSGYSNAAIVRFKSNGKYDNTFGTNGISTIVNGFFCDMALTSTNKIIVAGGGVSTSNLNNYVVYRLKGNGNLDSTFGINGSVAISMTGGNMICFDVALQDNGKIVLGGYIDNGSGGQHKLLVIRLNINGSLDTSFGAGGKFILDTGNKDSECRQLSIQADGKIVAGGLIDTIIDFSSFRYDFTAVRLKKNGTLDPTFATGGIFRGDKSTRDICFATAILSDGRIILGGVSEFAGKSQFTAVCLKPNGNPDNSFGAGGWKFIDFFGGSSSCNALAVESDDDIIMAGDVNLSIVGLAKIQSNGQLDPTFGTGGVDTSTLTLAFKGCNDVSLDIDNKIVITGYSYSGNYSSYMAARFTNSLLKAGPEELQQDRVDLKVYPNPVTDELFLSESSYSIDEIGISDLTGRKIIQIKNPKLPLNVSIISSGIFLCTVKSNGQVFTSKFIKE